MSCKSCKYSLSEVSVKGPLLDLGKWIKLPELPVAPDQQTKDFVILGIAALFLAAVVVVKIAKS